MQANGASFLGIGWGFPVATDHEIGEGPRLARAHYEDSVRQGMLLVLSTAKGERVMRPGFGCALQELLFAPNDATTRGMAESAVHEALLQWEPRIEVLAVAATSDHGEGERLLISVDYCVRKTDTRFNLVYPFYLARPLR
jgi:phage baseplate assembly protein W